MEISKHSLHLKPRSRQEVFHFEREDAMQSDGLFLPSVHDPPVRVDLLPPGLADGRLRGGFVRPGAVGSDLSPRRRAAEVSRLLKLAHLAARNPREPGHILVIKMYDELCGWHQVASHAREAFKLVAG